MDHIETPHDDRRHSFVDGARILLNEVVDILHDDKAVVAGERLTIDVNYDCGFTGRIIFEVDNNGSHE